MMTCKTLLLPALLLATTLTAHAQSLSGSWQGVETDPNERGEYWPTELRLHQSKSGGLLGVLYQQVGSEPDITVTFQVRGARTATGLQLEHGRKLQETGQIRYGNWSSNWCFGALHFRYDPAEETLTGSAAYQPIGDCDIGNFVFYRVKLKSAATVPAGASTTIRVSGRNVLWYADTETRQPLARGNSFRTRLRQTTTFYLAQGYYPTPQSTRVAIMVRVGGQAAPEPARPAPPEPLALGPVLLRQNPPPNALPDSLRWPYSPLRIDESVVLENVLFELRTAKLLSQSIPTLTLLAAELLARPDLRIQLAGHTDRIGNHKKNMLLSEQRAEAVRAYLIQAGVAGGRVITVGYGDARPLYPAPNERNRRVEVRVVD